MTKALLILRRGRGYFAGELRKSFQKDYRLNTGWMNEKQFAGYLREKGVSDQASQAEDSSTRNNRRWSF